MFDPELGEFSSWYCRIGLYNDFKTMLLEPMHKVANIATMVEELLGFKTRRAKHAPKSFTNCPFTHCGWGDHELTLHRTRNNWRCWRCDLGGDVVSFTAMHLSIPYFYALEIVAMKYGLSEHLDIVKDIQQRGRLWNIH